MSSIQYSRTNAMLVKLQVSILYGVYCFTKENGLRICHLHHINWYTIEKSKIKFLIKLPFIEIPTCLVYGQWLCGKSCSVSLNMTCQAIKKTFFMYCKITACTCRYIKPLIVNILK